MIIKKLIEFYDFIIITKGEENQNRSEKRFKYSSLLSTFPMLVKLCAKNVLISRAKSPVAKMERVYGALLECFGYL